MQRFFAVAVVQPQEDSTVPCTGLGTEVSKSKASQVTAEQGTREVPAQYSTKFPIHLWIFLIVFSYSQTKRITI